MVFYELKKKANLKKNTNSYLFSLHETDTNTVLNKTHLRYIFSPNYPW